MKKILFLLVSSLFLSFMHPHYLSVADLKYNEKEKKIEGFVKIFTHDFESALKKVHKRPIDLLNPGDKNAAVKILQDYLVSNFSISADKKKVQYEVIGFENEQEHTYLYLESDPVSRPKTIDIRTSVLFETFREQTNIVHLEINNAKKSLKVTNPLTDLKFEF